MALQIVNSWWSLVVRGLVAIIMGLITFAWPGITLTALVLVFGAYALIDGVMSLVGVWRAASAHERWAGLLIEGIAGIAAAVITGLVAGHYGYCAGLHHRGVGAGYRSFRTRHCGAPS